MTSQPYRSTPVFDQSSLPSALMSRHNTKAGVWGVIKVLEGELKLTYLDPQSELVLSKGDSAVVEPQQWHYVTPSGEFQMQVDFYDAPPASK